MTGPAYPTGRTPGHRARRVDPLAAHSGAKLALPLLPFGAWVVIVWLISIVIVLVALGALVVTSALNGGPVVTATPPATSPYLLTPMYPPPLLRLVPLFLIPVRSAALPQPALDNLPAPCV